MTQWLPTAAFEHLRTSLCTLRRSVCLSVRRWPVGRNSRTGAALTRSCGWSATQFPQEICTASSLFHWAAEKLILLLPRSYTAVLVPCLGVSNFCARDGKLPRSTSTWLDIPLHCPHADACLRFSLRASLCAAETNSWVVPRLIPHLQNE
jgi:hypothetical protein